MGHAFTKTSGLKVLHLSILMLGSTMLANEQATAANHAIKPLDTQSDNELPDMQLMLEVVINGRNTDLIAPVTRLDQHYYMANADIQALNLPIDVGTESSIAIDTLHNLVVRYDSNNQQLLINMPLSWLPQQYLNAQRPTPPVPAQTSTGFIFNYDIYSHKTSAARQPETSIYSEQRLFGDFGFLANNGLYAHNPSASNQPHQNKYLRYDTRWYYNDEQRMLQYAAGDITTDALAWTGSVRLGGIRFGRNFDTNPNLITYPLPQFSGQAAVPSAVDLYINSFKQSAYNVNPGPFTIETMPYVNGAGQATIITTDALGRQVSTSLPFYVSSSLLKPGLSDFSVSIGALRQDYGINSFKYGDLAASGVIRYGLNQYITLDARAEGAQNLAVGGAGATLMLGQFGVLNGSYSNSHAGSEIFPDAKTSPSNVGENTEGSTLNGQQTSIGYAYNNAFFSLNAKHLVRNNHYGELASYKSLHKLDRRISQLTGSISLKQYGSIGLGYFDVRQSNDDHLRLFNLSYSRSLWQNTNLFISANRAKGGQGYSAQVALSIPLSGQQMASLSSSKNEKNHWTQRVDYSQTAPENGGFGWQLAYEDGHKQPNRYQQINLDWQTQKARLQGGIYGNHDKTYWSELSGAIILMDQQVYASKQVNDAFTLVSTDGQSNVPILYENRLMGQTDQNGYLLIPSVSSYVQGLYEIDPLNLDADLNPIDVRKRQAVKQGGGLLITFPIRKIQAANLTLVDEQGQPLPRGSMVSHAGNTQTAYVGWDGIAYVEHIGSKNQLHIRRSDNQQLCFAQFIPEHTIGIQTPLMPIICKSEQS